MRNKDGFTLVEMVITLLISSIVLFFLGTIIVTANEWWIRSRTQMASMDEMRYAQRRMGFLMRNAAYVPLQTFEYPGDGGLLKFNNGQSRFALEDGRLMYHSLSGNEVVLCDVVRAEVHIMGEGDLHLHKLNYRHKSCVWVTLVTEKSSLNGEIITSSSTFVVKSRNSGL